MMKKIAFVESPHNTYDPSLDAEEKNNPNPFPEKMAMAIEFIEMHGLPPHIKHTKKSKKKVQQAEVLTVFSVDPSEKKMQQLKDFLHELFGDELVKLEVKHKEKRAA
jgi:hypothetical protein